MMQPQVIFGISVLLGFVVWGLIGARYIWPALRGRPRAEALRPLLLLHAFRFVGLAFLVPGVVSADLPGAFARCALLEFLETSSNHTKALLSSVERAPSISTCGETSNPMSALSRQDQPDYRALQPFGQVPIFDGSVAEHDELGQIYRTRLLGRAIGTRRELAELTPTGGVRKGGLEPPRVFSPQDPESCASANSATFARGQM